MAEGNRVRVSKLDYEKYPSLSPFKPIFITTEEGVTDLERKAVRESIEETLTIADVSDQISVKDFGHWRHDDHLNEDGSLKPHMSVDYYLQEGREASNREHQLNGSAIMRALKNEYCNELNRPWHYDVMILHSDLYTWDLNFIIGIATKDEGTVISIRRFRSVDEELRYEVIKTETFHEVGHVFGLISYKRTKNVENNIGRHCANTCSMRQGAVVPHDWIKMTKERLDYGKPYCDDCVTELKESFHPNI